MADPPDLTADIAENAASPQSIVTDGLSVTSHDLAQQRETDKYFAAKRAAQSPLRGLGLTQIIPGDHR
jgi:hypothetical protein